VLSFLFTLLISANAANNQHPAVKGCHTYLKTTFEDGVTVNRFINANIIKPLETTSKTQTLAKFLQQALIADAYLKVDSDLCKSIEVAVTK
jgi:hypothetical protein